MKSFLSQLPQIVRKSKKRLGRGHGSGAGIKSGRGTTRHQKARGTIAPWFEGGQARITKKYPLLRGKTRNKPVSEAFAINVSQLNTLDITDVTIEVLVAKGIISTRDSRKNIKVLGKGILSKALTVKLNTSKAARIKIEQAGGSVIV